MSRRPKKECTLYWSMVMVYYSLHYARTPVRSHNTIAICNAQTKEMMNACMYYYCHIAIWFSSQLLDSSLLVYMLIDLFPQPKKKLHNSLPCCVLFCIIIIRPSLEFDRNLALHKVV